MSADVYEDKLKNYLTTHNVTSEHLHFEQSCHSVADAADAAGAEPSQFVKNICMITEDGELVLAIVKGEDRASTSRVAKALQIERPRLATESEILERTGYPCGGTPSFGFVATFLVDPRVMEEDIVYTGGGSEYSLVKIATHELTRTNKATIVRVRK